VRVADINDRLERLSRRDELTRRARERAVPRAIAGVGPDFMEVVEAVVGVVRRHPGMSVMIAPGDGRRRNTVVRVTERNGEAEVAPVMLGTPDDGYGDPGYGQPGPPDQSYPDLVPPEFTHPGLVRPDFSVLQPDPGYPGGQLPPPPRGPEPWRPPPTEIPTQPQPFESSWSWEG
jgi:hypothetical protein